MRIPNYGNRLADSGTGQGYEPAFINMVVVRSSSVVAAGGLGSSDELTYDARYDSQSAVIPGEGPLRDLTPNWSLDFRYHLQRAASEFPNFYEVHYAMGVAHLSLGHQKQAEQAFQQSIDASGGRYAAPHFGLSVLLCCQQKFTEAEPIIRKALELAPSFGPGYFTLAWALFGLNRLDEAEKNAHEALMRNPTFAPAHFLLANIHNRRSDFSAALVELDACLWLAPDGAPSDQARRFQEFIKEKLARSTLILEAARAKP
jgi:tetratricopeptide (TPR) repeat protein